jgi:hypothetical protein
VNLGWYRDSYRVSVVHWCQVVKDQGGRLLTSVGGDGGTEDRITLRSLRHRIIGGRSLGPGWRVCRRWRGFGGLGRLRGLRLTGLPLLLRLLHVLNEGIGKLERSSRLKT